MDYKQFIINRCTKEELEQTGIDGSCLGKSAEVIRHNIYTLPGYGMCSEITVINPDLPILNATYNIPNIWLISKEEWDIIKDLVPLSNYPNIGDIVYEDNYGLVEYRVNEQYLKSEYPEILSLTVVKDYGNGHYKTGHLSTRTVYFGDNEQEREYLGDLDKILIRKTD